VVLVRRRWRLVLLFFASLVLFSGIAVEFVFVFVLCGSI